MNKTEPHPYFLQDMIMAMDKVEKEIEDTLRELRQTFTSGKTRSISWRKKQLNAIIALIHDNEEKICKALYQDLGKHPTEAYRDEIGIIEKTTNYALSNLEKWMAPTKGYMPLVFFPATGEILPEPLGVVLIISAWNFPITLCLEPLIGAISAGNVAVVKPSELAPACSSLLAEIIPHYLDFKAVRVVQGAVDISACLLQQKWDKIFFTGSPRVGRIVMSAAANHLTPVTLELGGKCPAIFDYHSVTSDVKVAVKRIAAGKWGPCCGQICIGIDYCLVETRYASSMIELLKKAMKSMYGADPKHSKTMSRIVNKHHFKRLQDLLHDPAVSATIVHGGSMDEDELYIEPTVLLDPPLDSKIMTEEIFGPVLPIITLDNIQQSIEFLNSRPKPLAIYPFTKDESFKKRILSETSSGSVTFNDVVIQVLCDELPFGGVGQSGMGRYHGKYSFDTFSHEKAVMRRTFFLDLDPIYPPWNNFKQEFIRLAYRYDYFGLLLLVLGLKRY